MDEILKEILNRDKNILARRDDLIKILDEQVPNNQRRTYAALRKALTLNVGEIFLVNDFSDWEKQERARQILKESGMQDAKINHVINIFVSVLNLNPQLKKYNLEEKIIALDESLNACLLINQKLLLRIKKLENQIAEIDTLKKRIAVLEKEIANLKLANDFNKTASKNSTAPNEIKPARPKIYAKIETPPPSNLLDKRKDFINDFNALNNFAPNEKRVKRNEFFNKYQIRAFNCKNYNERMNNPALKPEFEITTQAINGEYWAYEIGSNTFAIAPNVKSYNYNCHVARAMGEVFDSNFVSGFYSNIQLERAAEFINSGQNWTLVKKGKLILR